MTLFCHHASPLKHKKNRFRFNLLNMHTHLPEPLRQVEARVQRWHTGLPVEFVMDIRLRAERTPLQHWASSRRNYRTHEDWNRQCNSTERWAGVNSSLEITEGSASLSRPPRAVCVPLFMRGYSIQSYSPQYLIQSVKHKHLKVIQRIFGEFFLKRGVLSVEFDVTKIRKQTLSYHAVVGK